MGTANLGDFKVNNSKYPVSLLIFVYFNMFNLILSTRTFIRSGGNFRDLNEYKITFDNSVDLSKYNIKKGDISKMHLHKDDIGL